MKDKIKNAINFLKELKKKPYGKAVFFFSFYFIFFVVLIIFIRTSIKTPTDNDKNDNKNNILDMSVLTSNDYSFTYEVKLDDKIYNYKGIKKSSLLQYKVDNKEYYQENLKTYVKDVGWNLVDSPIMFNKYLDESIIDSIVNSSYKESKTEYEDGTNTLNLLISSNTLNKILDNKETDYSEMPNKVSVTINADGYIVEINYNLDSYCMVENKCDKALSLNVKYSDFYTVNKDVK